MRQFLDCDIQPVDNVGDLSEDAVEELPDLNDDNNDIMDISVESLDYEPDDEPDCTTTSTTTFRALRPTDNRIILRESHSDISESASEYNPDVKSGSSSDDEQQQWH